MTSTQFEGGFSVLPPIISEDNYKENLDLNSNKVDKNCSNSSRVVIKDINEDINSNSIDTYGKGREGLNSLPEAPFSSILQSKRSTYLDENR